MSQKQLVYDTLNRMGIAFACVEHPAVFTIEEMQKLDLPAQGKIAKNLFLRDAKGKRHFLLTVDSAHKVNLKLLEMVLGSSKLSFASDERLQKHLGLVKGAVTPLGLLNDTAGNVEFYLDEGLCQGDEIGVHPNDNTATVFLSPDDLMAFARETGHEVHLIPSDSL